MRNENLCAAAQIHLLADRASNVISPRLAVIISRTYAEYRSFDGRVRIYIQSEPSRSETPERESR